MCFEEVEHPKIRKEIRTTNLRAHNWIERSLTGKKKNLALCKDDGRRFNVTTTNASKNFNDVLRGARSLFVRTLVAHTFR